MSTKFNRVLAAGLCLVMLIGIFPIGSIAYNQNFVSQTHDVFKHTESTIAPGVEQYTNYAYAKDSKQMVYYVATADISRDDVIVQTAYKDAQCTDFGMDKLTNQMAAANAKYSDKNNDAFISEYYQAVVGTNGDFYNMTTGQPTGAFVMDGVMQFLPMVQHSAVQTMQIGMQLLQRMVLRSRQSAVLKYWSKTAKILPLMRPALTILTATPEQWWALLLKERS